MADDTTLEIDLTVVDPAVVRIQEVAIGILSGRVTVIVEIDPAVGTLEVTMSGGAEGHESDMDLLREVGAMLSQFEASGAEVVDGG